MKSSAAILIILMTFNSLLAQNGRNVTNIPPNIPEKSVLFANDIYINDQPQQNQRRIAICSAFNGWLYALYPYFDSNVNQDVITFLRSKDNGASWFILNYGPIGAFHTGIVKLEILACGHDTNNLKVFAGYYIYDTATMERALLVTRYDKNCVMEGEFLHGQSVKIRDFAIAGDDLYPASNSNPFSFAVVYSTGTLYKDSIEFYSSSNGGISFDTKYKIASSPNYFDKVGLAYGHSATCNSGRYFAAWEEKANPNSVSGHIYTAHSEPNFNSPFTSPLLVDNLDTSTSNRASTPVIACQNNAADNDSSNLTEVVLFEKYIPTTQSFNIAGLYNKKATASNYFQKFTIDPSSDNKLQPDICFNAFDSTFIVTYFDSTALKLPYYTHNFNMTDPDTWIELSSGYNDDNNLAVPNPKVATDFATQTGMVAWIGIRVNGNGAAMFDAPFHYPVGISENKITDVKIYPNPSNGEITLENIPTDKPLFIYDMMGKIVLYRNTTINRMNLKLNVPGVYLLKTGDFKIRILIKNE